MLAPIWLRSRPSYRMAILSASPWIINACVESIRYRIASIGNMRTAREQSPDFGDLEIPPQGPTPPGRRGPFLRIMGHDGAGKAVPARYYGLCHDSREGLRTGVATTAPAPSRAHRVSRGHGLGDRQPE